MSLFFALDSPLPKAGEMVISLPSGAAHTPSTSGVHVWALGTNFAVPTTATNSGTCSAASFVLTCSFANDLAANTAYGIVLPGSGAVKGSWAPVSIQTRMNTATAQGPIRDHNRVFDSINTLAAAPAITLAVAKITPADATELKYPGESPNMEWTVTMAAWAATEVVKAPWNLVLRMDTNSARNRASTTANPVTYDDWTWVTTCTNTQWGIDDADTSDNVPAATLKNKNPKCTVVSTTTYHDLVIPIDQDLTSTDYSTFKIKF